MTRVGVRGAMYLARRTLVAMTCRGCGQLKDGSAFGRRTTTRDAGYIDRRCGTCRWRHAESSPGRNRTHAL